MTTHAHYRGEFGSQRQTPQLAKDPSYRAARAEHFAKVAQASALKHASAVGSDRAAHALVVEHAVKMSAKHARAAERMTPGSEHATRAVQAHQVARLAHASLVHAEPPITSTETRTSAAKAATKSAFAKTKIASDSPNVKTQEAAAAAHRAAAKANQGDEKTVALHERQVGHHQNRADAMRLGMDAPRIGNLKQARDLIEGDHVQFGVGHAEESRPIARVERRGSSVLVYPSNSDVPLRLKSGSSILVKR